MKLPFHPAVPSIGCLALLLAGCQSDEPTPPAINPSPPPLVKPVSPVADGSAEVEATTPTPVASTQEEFTPPFPERVDFFVPPRRARTAQRGDEVVELRGFITPPDDRGTLVLLAINGTESPIAAGQEKMGVKVISIEQPKVVLQRGRNRWTESLE